MANSLGLPEVTLAQLADSTHDVNTYEYPFEKRTARVTDHADNTALEEDDPYKMAIFECQSKGKPWTKKDNVLNTVVHQGTTSIPANVSTLYPDWDYTEF